MRLIKHLTEKYDPYQEYIVDNPDIPDDDKSLITSLHRDCGIFLRSISFAQKCFRGRKRGLGNKIEFVVPRKDRTPSDLPAEVHNELNKEFKKKFGWNVRSEGVFCAPNIYISDAYGTSYYFFPIGKFKMVYANQIDDVLDRLKDDGAIIGRSNSWDYTPIDDEPNYFKNLVGEYTQDTNNAKKALYSSAEIMCQCKSYYLADTDWVTKWYNEVFSISERGFAQGKKI